MDTRQTAQLQSRLDHIETELGFLDNLLRKCGFPEGIQTLKEAATELLIEDTQGISFPKEL